MGGGGEVIHVFSCSLLLLLSSPLLSTPTIIYLSIYFTLFTRFYQKVSFVTWKSSVYKFNQILSENIHNSSGA